ncbi:MAG TPA: hypothetical protein VD905_02600, partial [Flavobacteriales bacterium]|nr:hypothetical protein [Flavobacteriales bacterium]
ITGPKTDVWLVKTVAVLLVVISLCMILYVKTGGSELPVMVQGGITAIGLMVIDFYYVSKDVISPIYAWDGVIQAIFFLLWGIIFIRWLKDIY